MGQLEESLELTLDFTKLEKVGKQVADTREGGLAPCDPGVIPVAIQNYDTKEVILVAYTNEFAMKESFAKRKLILWSTSRNKLWFKAHFIGAPCMEPRARNEVLDRFVLISRHPNSSH